MGTAACPLVPRSRSGRREPGRRRTAPSQSFFQPKCHVNVHMTHATRGSPAATAPTAMEMDGTTAGPARARDDNPRRRMGKKGFKMRAGSIISYLQIARGPAASALSGVSGAPDPASLRSLSAPPGPGRAGSLPCVAVARGSAVRSAVRSTLSARHGRPHATGSTSDITACYS